MIIVKGDSEDSIEMRYEDGELQAEATVKKYLTVQTEGERQILINLCCRLRNNEKKGWYY